MSKNITGEIESAICYFALMKTKTQIQSISIVLLTVLISTIARADKKYITCSCFWENNYVGNSREFIGKISLVNQPGLQFADADTECRRGNPSASSRKVFADDCYDSPTHINTLRR